MKLLFTIRRNASLRKIYNVIAKIRKKKVTPNPLPPSSRTASVILSTNICNYIYLQVSLHSVTMEDLTKDVDSKHRMLMVSHTPQVPKAVYVSKSCPDFITEYPDGTINSAWTKYSLPNELNKIDSHVKFDKKCGVTPPCSPVCEIADEEERLSGDENLVWISVHQRDPQHPLFEEKYNKVS